jgi:hypothetical protein
MLDFDISVPENRRVLYIANDHFDGKNKNAPLELLEYPIFRQPLMQSPSQKTSEQTQPVHFASQFPGFHHNLSIGVFTRAAIVGEKLEIISIR